MARMAETERTSPQIIVEEIRRQVDLQVSAFTGIETKAMAVFGGVAAVAAIIADRVKVENGWQALAAGLTLATLLAALVSLLMSVLPRIGGFSNGPDVVELGGRIDEPTVELERDLVPSFVEVRKRNEKALRSKGMWMIGALSCLIGTVGGIAFMVVVGAVK